MERRAGTQATAGAAGVAARGVRGRRQLGQKILGLLRSLSQRIWTARSSRRGGHAAAGSGGSRRQHRGAGTAAVQPRRRARAAGNGAKSMGGGVRERVDKGGMLPALASPRAEAGWPAAVTVMRPPKIEV